MQTCQKLQRVYVSAMNIDPAFLVADVIVIKGAAWSICLSAFMRTISIFVRSNSFQRVRRANA